MAENDEEFWDDDLDAIDALVAQHHQKKQNQAAHAQSPQGAQGAPAYRQGSAAAGAGPSKLALQFGATGASACMPGQQLAQHQTLLPHNAGASNVSAAAMHNQPFTLLPPQPPATTPVAQAPTPGTSLQQLWHSAPPGAPAPSGHQVSSTAQGGASTARFGALGLGTHTGGLPPLPQPATQSGQHLGAASYTNSYSGTGTITYPGVQHAGHQTAAPANHAGTQAQGTQLALTNHHAQSLYTPSTAHANTTKTTGNVAAGVHPAPDSAAGQPQTAPPQTGYYAGRMQAVNETAQSSNMGVGQQRGTASMRPAASGVTDDLVRLQEELKQAYAGQEQLRQRLVNAEQQRNEVVQRAGLGQRGGLGMNSSQQVVPAAQQAAMTAANQQVQQLQKTLTAMQERLRFAEGEAAQASSSMAEKDAALKAAEAARKELMCRLVALEQAESERRAEQHRSAVPLNRAGLKSPPKLASVGASSGTVHHGMPQPDRGPSTPPTSPPTQTPHTLATGHTDSVPAQGALQNPGAASGHVQAGTAQGVPPASSSLPAQHTQMGSERVSGAATTGQTTMAGQAAGKMLPSSLQPPMSQTACALLAAAVDNLPSSRHSLWQTLWAGGAASIQLIMGYAAQHACGPATRTHHGTSALMQPWWGSVYSNQCGAPLPHQGDGMPGEQVVCETAQHLIQNVQRQLESLSTGLAGQVHDRVATSNPTSSNAGHACVAALSNILAHAAQPCRSPHQVPAGNSTQHAPGVMSCSAELCVLVPACLHILALLLLHSPSLPSLLLRDRSTGAEPANPWCSTAADDADMVIDMPKDQKPAQDSMMCPTLSTQARRRAFACKPRHAARFPGQARGACTHQVASPVLQQLLDMCWALLQPQQHKGPLCALGVAHVLHALAMQLGQQDACNLLSAALRFESAKRSPTQADLQLSQSGLAASKQGPNGQAAGDTEQPLLWLASLVSTDSSPAAQLVGSALLARLLDCKQVVVDLAAELHAHAAEQSAAAVSAAGDALPVGLNVTNCAAQQIMMAVLECLQCETQTASSAGYASGPSHQRHMQQHWHTGSCVPQIVVPEDPCRSTPTAALTPTLAALKRQRMAMQLLHSLLVAYRPQGHTLLHSMCLSAQRQGVPSLAQRLLAIADAAVLNTWPGCLGSKCGSCHGCMPHPAQPVVPLPLLAQYITVAFEALSLLRDMLMSVGEPTCVLLLEDLCADAEAQHTLHSTAEQLRDWGAAALLLPEHRQAEATGLASWARHYHTTHMCEAGSGPSLRSCTGMPSTQVTLEICVERVGQLANSILSRVTAHLQRMESLQGYAPMQGVEVPLQTYQ